MNLRPHRREPADINLTPLIDVVFLLLIFFMVSTSFKDEARLRIQLPEAEGQQTPSQEPKMLRVVIDASGDYYVNDLAVADHRPQSLRKALVAALGSRGQLPVLIQADADSTHQSVMTVLDVAGQLGLVQVAFAATHPNDENAQP